MYTPYLFYLDWTEKAEQLSTDDIVEFLKSIKLQLCIKAVKAAEVDGSMMVAAVESDTDQMLVDIGIKRAHHVFKVRNNFSKFVQNL